VRFTRQYIYLLFVYNTGKCIYVLYIYIPLSYYFVTVNGTSSNGLFSLAINVISFSEMIQHYQNTCSSFKISTSNIYVFKSQFTTTYAIAVYHHWCCEFESRSGWGVQHYVIKFVSDLRQLCVFFRVLRFPPPIKLTATI
jgi:hypothetical protein